MAKNKKVPTNENAEIEKSDEILEVKKTKTKISKEEKKKIKEQAAKKANKKAQKNEKPKRHFIKETTSELKKVSWPSFAKACKQTGTVLVVVAVFMLAVLGIDTLISWIINLIVNI